jgi:hypothetical protein
MKVAHERDLKRYYGLKLTSSFCKLDRFKVMKNMLMD